MSAAIAREAGVHWWESGMLAELANLSLNAGRIDEADMQARESLAVADQIGDHAGRVFGVGLLARVSSRVRANRTRRQSLGRHPRCRRNRTARRLAAPPSPI